MEILSEWYLILSKPSALLAGPLGDLATRMDLPLASAFIFGLIGAVAPCQLTTNGSAMAYLARGGGRSAAGREAAAFCLGKILVYSALGALALALGTQLQRAVAPMSLVTRRALGPILVMIGLSLLGVLRLRGGFGTRISASLERVARRSGTAGAFLMGGAFALAFCPTLFWLFFGLTLPLALGNPLAPAFPALFALGTSVPVLLLGVLLTRDRPDARIGLGRAGALLSRVAGVVFIVAGLNDTLTYWTL